MTFFTWVFSLALLFLVVRTLIALRRVRSTANTQDLEASLQLAVLKENLLENALEANLDRLVEFCRQQDLKVEPELYRPLLQRQRKLRSSAELLAEDSVLYEEQSRWLDTLEPIEFQEAREAHGAGDFEAYTQFFLHGVLRFYSDDKIIESLGVLETTAHYHDDFPLSVEKIQEMTASYKSLCAKRDSSHADPAALEILRQEKEAWVRTVQEAASF